MPCEEILRAVFPFLEGKDLVACMLVCKQWLGIAQDDYFWKCSCAKRWPSVCKKPSPPTNSYHELYKAFHKPQVNGTFLMPKLLFSDLEFFFDIWDEERLILSEVVPGPVLLDQTWADGISDSLPYFNLETLECNMIFPVQPSFNITSQRTVTTSVFVGRKDTRKVASIINKAEFICASVPPVVTAAYGKLNFAHPFMVGMTAFVLLHYMGYSEDEFTNVYGIQLVFPQDCNTEAKILWLLDMLVWH